MAVITQTTNALGTDGPVTLARTTLSASDTLTFSQGSRQQLFLYNPTAGLLTATLIGSTATTVSVPGYGGTVSVAGGKAIPVAANSSVLVDLDDIYAYLQGNVTVTGGTGLVAHLYN